MNDEKVAFEIQLWRLSELGFGFVDGCSPDDLLVGMAKDDYECEPYWLVMTEMGGEADKEGVDHLSDDVAYLDSECIYGPEDYIAFVQRVATIARRVVGISDIEVRMPPGSSHAEIDFVAGGTRYGGKVPVREDWLAEEALELLGRAIRKHGAGSRLLVGQGGGQDFMLCVGDLRLRSALQELTGPMWKWHAQ